MIVDLIEHAILAALRTTLLAYLPANTEVFQGQDNRVGSPTKNEYVVMTPLLRERLATNVDTYADNGTTQAITVGHLLLGKRPLGAAAGTTANRITAMATKFTVQLDVHGPTASDNAQLIAMLYRSDIAACALAAINPAIQPLYTSEPRQTQFITGEKQYESRWTVDVVLQANINAITAQQFAGTLSVGVVDVDAVYPP